MSRPRPAHRWLCLATLSVGISLIMVDGTIVNVALPTLITDLRITATEAEWVNAGYMLVFAALLLPAGRLGDVLGHRRLFGLGVVTFVVASALAGLAQGGATLLTARLLQGVGAAMILPATLSTINTAFRGRDRAMAFGVWGAAIGATVAIGPVLGGWLTDAFGWRWIFVVNVPLGLLVLAGTALWVPESRDRTAALRTGVVGTLSASAGFAALVLVLIEGQRYGWWTPTRPFEAGSFTWPFDAVSPIPPVAALGVLLIGVFVVATRRRRRRGDPVLLDVTLFAIPSFRIGNVAIAIVGLAEFGLVFVLPLYLQAALGLSPLRAGVIILALALGSLLAGPGAGPLTQRYGPRRVVLAGLLLETVAIAAIGVVMSPSGNLWPMALLLFVYGVGVGLASAQLSNIVLADVPVERSGQASGAQNTTRLLGSALGIAVLGTVLVSLLGTNVDDRLRAMENLPPQTREAVSASVRDSLGATIPDLRDAPETAPAAVEAERALTRAARTVTFLTALFMLAGFLLSLRLPRDAGLRGHAGKAPGGTLEKTAEH
ncbi:EmrB/QacA subfamily drug resistance transporter [Actinomadura pelletieri DSM 43383]|uniref:EmrB/QacA subfamily drug resistance transporter n=1 Tax=Actinomadura pelletieri DSM 43383 TaxID=1120940 RepID=A0A495QU75_9ACTN|nr:MFS transporter [Actinomadura pelletieri]RKS77039.1 EmrB/QacA subfamily drug resistance transporter [Actinomadura pelletieri DSM 43383]